MIENCTLGADVKIPFPDLCNLYGCTIGDGSFVGPFVEIQRGVIIGERCKIESHSFLCSGVIIADEVFVGHGVMFCNDHYPDIGVAPPRLYKTIVGEGTIIGSGATILPCRIGSDAIIGAGAVVTKDVPALCVAAGNPAHIVKRFDSLETRDKYFATRKRDHLQPLQG